MKQEYANLKFKDGEMVEDFFLRLQTLNMTSLSYSMPALEVWLCTIFCIGSVATGDLNFTSTEHLQPAPLVRIAAPAAVSDSTSLFATFDGLDISSTRNEAQSAPSNQDSVQGASGGRKRKQSHIGATIEGFVQYNKMQTSKTMEALNEKKKQDEEFSVHKCLDKVDAMELTDVEKAYAMNIFKSEIDREAFMKMKNKNVRLIWLK